MAWTDTTPCSFCGREIPIHKRFGNGRFCSKAHEEAFLQQQNQLAVEVLHRTHDALKAYRPTSSSIEDILGLPTKASMPAPAVLETPPDPDPPAAEEQSPQVPESWLEPPADAIPVAESREFDLAASAMLPRTALVAQEEAAEEEAVWEGVEEIDHSESVGQPTRAMDREIFHFGDSLGKMSQAGFLSSLRRLWHSLTGRR